MKWAFPPKSLKLFPEINISKVNSEDNWSISHVASKVNWLIGAWRHRERERGRRGEKEREGIARTQRRD